MRPIPGFFYFNPEPKLWLFVPGTFLQFQSGPYRILAETGMCFSHPAQAACFNDTGLYISVGITPQFAEETLSDFGRDPETFTKTILGTLIRLLTWRFEDAEAIYRAGTLSPDEADSPAYSSCQHSDNGSGRNGCKGSRTSAEE